MNIRFRSPLCLLIVMCSISYYITGCCRGETSSINAAKAWVEDTYTDSIPQEDYDGYSFRVLVQNRENGLNDHNTVSAEELTGCTYQDAVYERNIRVENLLNISIVQNSGDVRIRIETENQAESLEYDVAYPDLKSAVVLSMKSLLHDLNELDDINLNMPWWDKASVRDLTVFERLYYAENSINIQYIDVTYLLFFNKQLLSQLQLENPCNLVRDGKWTFDVFYSMIQAASQDVNNNGVADAPVDYFGLKYSGYLKEAMLSGAREYLIIPDGNDGYKQNVESINVQHVAEFAEKILSDTKSIVIAWQGEGMEPFVINENTVYNGHTLFCEDRLCGFEQLTASSNDTFGFVPYPKVKQEQASYGVGTYWSRETTLCYVIPKKEVDIYRTCHISEALAIYSYELLYNDYYASLYKNDSDCYDMLRIIDDSRIYDLGFIYDWGGVAELYDNMYSNRANEIDYNDLSMTLKFEKQMNKTKDIYKPTGK